MEFVPKSNLSLHYKHYTVSDISRNKCCQHDAVLNVTVGNMCCTLLASQS